MSNSIQTVEQDAQLMESVLLGGDLSKLAPHQRVNYYYRVCESLGLNPHTKPFDYIQLNGKLTLYAKKDAADQLRKINGVSIDDVDISETEKQFIVKVKGHDKEGRADVEVGVVNKNDMRGDTANAQMKAVTKAKRRLTLSLCGLGWLDETEVQTIPGAKPVDVADTGEIVEAESNGGVPKIEHAPQQRHTAASNGSRIWSYSQKQVLIDERLADNDFSAKGMLGLSNLREDATEAEILAWGKTYRTRRNTLNEQGKPLYTAQEAAEYANAEGNPSPY